MGVVHIPVIVQILAKFRNKDNAKRLSLIKSPPIARIGTNIRKAFELAN